jgi:hypothetical protein
VTGRDQAAGRHDRPQAPPADLTDTRGVTYDLYVLPVDRALASDEVAAAIDAAGGSRFGLGHDRRLDPFIASMERRYGRLRGIAAAPPFEFDVLRSHVFIGLPWSGVEEGVAVIAGLAYEAGLAVWDPQREAVGLPAPHAEAPLSAEGTEAHVHEAERAFAAIERGAAMAPPGDDEAAQQAIAEELTAEGFRTWSPLGFEITPDLADEVAADPLRMPASLQVPERRDELLAALADDRVGDRHQALVQLAAWDPDPAVAAALRPLLRSEDVFEASQAAAGLARQRDITDLPALLDLVHRLSPDDGGTGAAMLGPLRATLDLAALAGPEIVEGVRVRARTWRGAGARRRSAWEGDVERELDGLLGPA